MINNSIKSLVGVSILIGTLTGCGGSVGKTSPSAINFAITGDNNMALNGSQKLLISIKSIANLNLPINMTITNSDSSIVSIIQNTCVNGLTEKSTSCYVFIRGDKVGNANITATIAGYGSEVKPITVAKQWGSMGGSFGGGISELSVTGDKVYVLYSEYVYMSENGSSWQIVGGGKAFDSYYFNGGGLVSDASHVCVTTRYNGRDKEKNISVKCSKNGGNWYEIGNFDADVGTNILTGASSIYNNNIYISVWHQGSGTGLSFCSIDNCNGWQEFGQRLSSAPYDLPMAIYNTTAIAGKDSTKIYYLNSDGNWKLHGDNSSGNCYYISSINEFGVFILPEQDDSISYPYQQQIYYNDNNNIGGKFKAIGGNILIESPIALTNHAFAVANNTVFVALGDGRIFSSTNLGNNNWAKWKQVGNNSGKLKQIYANDKNLYSIHDEASDDNAVYVYSLQ